MAYDNFSLSRVKREEIPITTIYGSVTSGTAWRFLKLEGNILNIDLIVYPVPPVEMLWMVGEG